MSEAYEPQLADGAVIEGGDVVYQNGRRIPISKHSPEFQKKYGGTKAKGKAKAKAKQPDVTETGSGLEQPDPEPTSEKKKPAVDADSTGIDDVIGDLKT